ncbi:MAG: HD domain-containing protein, partial [Deltaproteobacteria bacterium]|nr:HD domain-containing protein [Deltaproteobacteria bacterium]
MSSADDLAIEVLRNLNLAVKGINLYPAGHPSITHSISEVYKDISSILNTRDRMIIGLVEDVLVLDETPLYTLTDSIQELTSRMKKLDIGTITISRGVTEMEIRGGLLKLLYSDAADIERAGGFAPYMNALGVSQITVLEPKVTGEKGGADAARRVYKGAIDVVRTAMDEVRLGKIPSSTGAKVVISEMVDQVLENRSAILGLSMVKNYDEYTFHHCVNVSILSLALAEAVGMPKDVLNDLGVGAILHDIGKIDTYEGIIKKPGPLSEDEWKEVRKHPARGAEIIRKMEGISELSIRVVIEHHLKYNRQGYPQIEGAGSQSEPSMCVNIADCYDAITTMRPYQVPYNPGKALEYMHTLSGKDFEPHLLDRFIEVLGIYPPGTLVRLNTNEIAIVTAPNPKDPTQPKVRLVFDRLGRKVEGVQEFLLTEADEKGWRRSVLSVV